MTAEETEPLNRVPKPARIPSRLGWRKKSFFSMISMVVVLGCAEILCRLLSPTEPPEVEDYIVRWGHWQATNHQYAIRNIEPGFWVLRGSSINSAGFRDERHAVPKPPGSWRIACLGDSVTFGYQLASFDSYPAALRSALAGMGQRVEVFNAGVPGWCLFQEAKAYESILRKFGLDDVILGICLNDIPEMQNNLGHLEISRYLARLGKYSALMRVLIDADARKVESVRALFSEEDSPAIQNAWELVFESLLRLREQVSEDGGQLSVVVFPFRFQLGDDAPPAIPQRRIEAFCEGHEIPFLDVLPALREASGTVFLDYDHLNPLGCEIVADAIRRSGVLSRLARD